MDYTSKSRDLIRIIENHGFLMLYNSRSGETLSKLVSDSTHVIAEYQTLRHLLAEFTALLRRLVVCAKASECMVNSFTLWCNELAELLLSIVSTVRTPSELSIYLPIVTALFSESSLLCNDFSASLGVQLIERALGRAREVASLREHMFAMTIYMLRRNSSLASSIGLPKLLRYTRSSISLLSTERPFLIVFNHFLVESLLQLSTLYKKYHSLDDAESPLNRDDRAYTSSVVDEVLQCFRCIVAAMCRGDGHFSDSNSQESMVVRVRIYGFLWLLYHSKIYPDTKRSIAPSTQVHLRGLEFEYMSYLIGALTRDTIAERFDNKPPSGGQCSTMRAIDMLCSKRSDLLNFAMSSGLASRISSMLDVDMTIERLELEPYLVDVFKFLSNVATTTCATLLIGSRAPNLATQLFDILNTFTVFLDVRRQHSKPETVLRLRGNFDSVYYIVRAICYLLNAPDLATRITRISGHAVVYNLCTLLRLQMYYRPLQVLPNPVVPVAESDQWSLPPSRQATPHPFSVPLTLSCTQSPTTLPIPIPALHRTDAETTDCYSPMFLEPLWGSHVSGLVDKLTPMVPTPALDETPQTSALEKFTKLAANLGTLPEGLDQTQPCAVGLPVELLIGTLHKMAQADGVASTVTTRRRATWVANAIPIDELKTYAARVHHDALSNPALLTTDFLGELDDFIDTLSGTVE